MCSSRCIQSQSTSVHVWTFVAVIQRIDACKTVYKPESARDLSFHRKELEPELSVMAMPPALSPPSALRYCYAKLFCVSLVVILHVILSRRLLVCGHEQG
ncbi:hypothetical protein MLD38_021388 [Melastoma candidum]|uniref:Uncharacterized protein n=1 Tax=Melastoma candidum TaxID=119954 RepID=A0ACB9QF63_9MYRT|nr:hypothetical protein MLD38_021388 [Melastoma candidum]